MKDAAGLRPRLHYEKVGGEAGSIGWGWRPMSKGAMQVRHGTGSHNKAQQMSPGKFSYKGRATLACRDKISTRGIQPQHPPVITPHPSNPASVTFPLPPDHLSQKRLTHRRSLSQENASTARITGAKRDDGGGHHDDGPTTVLTTGAADGGGGTNCFDALRQIKLTVDFSMKSVRRSPCQMRIQQQFNKF